MTAHSGVLKESLQEEHNLIKKKGRICFDFLSVDKINPQLTRVFLISQNTDKDFDSVTNRCRPRIAHEYEIALFLEDGGAAVINQMQYEIKKWDLRIHKPGDIVYSYLYNSAYVLHFSLLEGEDDKLFRTDFLDSLPEFMPFVKPENLINLYERLIGIVGAITDTACVLKKKIIWEFINDLSENAEMLQKNSIKSTEFITVLTEYMKQNYMNRISLESMGKYTHHHPNYLHRVFKRDLGITPFEYLQNIRMEKSCELLLTTDLNIVSIAAECGFETPSYFISVFKKAYGMTPHEFRQNNLGLW